MSDWFFYLDSGSAQIEFSINGPGGANDAWVRIVCKGQIANQVIYDDIPPLGTLVVAPEMVRLSSFGKHAKVIIIVGPTALAANTLVIGCTLFSNEASHPGDPAHPSARRRIAHADAIIPTNSVLIAHEFSVEFP
jgi:hypothetical protein